jgi:hypothetical protein
MLPTKLPLPLGEGWGEGRSIKVGERTGERARVRVEESLQSQGYHSSRRGLG